MKNPALKDKYKAGYRVVTLGEYRYVLCTCFFHKFRNRGRGVCTHGGAAYLYDIYRKELGE